MRNTQKGFAGIAVLLVIILGIIGFFAWKHESGTRSPEGEEKHLPSFITALIQKEPNTEIRSCTQADGNTYYIADAVMIADEGNDVYAANGTKVDSCFGFVPVESISPFCKSLSTENCTVVYTPAPVAPDTEPHVFGNQEDLVSFSLAPGALVSGKMSVTGTVKGGYFFEGNILVNVLDAQMKVLKAGHGTATTNWMTAGPVSFKADLEVTGLPKGAAYIELKQDDPSDGESGRPIKQIHIPIIIK